MKRLVSSFLIGMMVISAGSVYANEVVAQPILISEVAPISAEEKASFEVEIEGDTFKIILEENPSTGYEWTQTINKAELVKLIDSDFKEAAVDLVGAGGQKILSYEALDQGVSTIRLELKRSWEEEAIKTIDVLVYKTDSKLFVEEDQIVSIQDGALACELVKESISGKIILGDETIEMKQAPRVVDGTMMIPLAETLRPLGYEVTWKAEDNTVEIKKGAQWTTVSFGKNAYFKNRMAAKPLSSMPISIENHTFVPAEFFTEILDLGFQVEDGQIAISESMMAIHSGYVKELNYSETGDLSITITRDLASTELADLTIIHTSSAFTISQKEVVIGEMINVVSPPVMTMSIPGQTSAYIIY